MKKEKKQIKELTDEQVNDAAGGARSVRSYYVCKGCNHTFSGRGIKTSSGTYCPDCAPKVTIL